MPDKGSFVLYTSYRAQVERLTIEQRGVLLTAILNHACEIEKPEMDAATDMAFSFIAAQLDRDNLKWEKIRQKRVEAGQKGGISSGESRKQSQANEANASLAKQTKQNQANEAVNVDVNVNADVDVNRESDATASAPSDTKISRHKYGVYGWVKLSDTEYSRLLAELGEATALFYINLVDEKAQQTGNKNKWKDWNLTVRKAIREKWGGEPQSQGKVWKSLD